MRVITAFVFCSLCLFTAGIGHGQETSHYLTPSGFYLPLLEKGEYVLSLNGYYYHQKSVTDYDDSLTPDGKYLYTYKYITFSGIYAFSNKLLLGTSLQFAPSQDLSTTDYWTYFSYDDIQLTTSTYHLSGRVSPNVTLVYRPATNIEIHAGYDFSYSKEERRYDPKPANTGMPVEKNTDHYVTVGLTYHGRL
jgi:hypothetical protein